ncbi:TetR/AcrR family transcriptional regulator [Polycladidibacter stylochi]|uniref:TetR/AcrR family transcriptional regulator n=1 Tax=Polycladidibacter stylochi TaxID=1807766 RepID=UPI00083655F7|nr:TetR/AcrR family transcriptional regulator [Pseudovibrio stylochi]
MLNEVKNEAQSWQADKSRRMKRQIVEAAITCLHQHGYHKASIKKISQISSFSQGALQHHFPTKQDLMVHVLERLLKKSINLTIEWIEGLGSHRARFSQLTRIMWHKQIRSPEFLAMVEILVAARTEMPLKERLKPSYDHYMQEMTVSISRHFSHSNLSPETVAMLARVSRCLLSGFISYDGVFMSEEDMEEFVSDWALFLEKAIC